MKKRTIYLENTSEKVPTGSLDGRCLGNSRWRGQDGSIELSFTDIITVVKLIKVFGFNYQFVVDVKSHIGLYLIKTRKACFLFFNSFHVLVSQIKSTRKIHLHTVHRQAILLLVVESGTRKFRCFSVECLSVESGTYDVICQCCTVKGMVVKSEILKAPNCALSKVSLPLHFNV